MKIKSLTLTVLGLTILGGCMAGPQNSTFTEQTTALNATKEVNGVEQLVDPKRMEANMAVITGKAPVINNIFIPERGSVEGRNLTRTFLTNTLEALGYKVEIQNYRKNGANVFVRLMADQPTDEYILAGGHLDSVKNAGAIDDGTGTISTLEAATVLPKLTGRKVNIIFAWFDEEELGLVGSEALASEFKKQGLKISSVHAMDMLGWDQDGDRAVEVARPDGNLWDYYKMVNETHQLKIPLERTNTGSSDHVSFHQKGYNSVCLSEEWVNGDTTPYYHQKKDVFETVNFEYLATGAKLLIAVLGDLSQKVPAPANIEMVPHNRFPGREKTFLKSYDDNH
jgi:Zn-dependent M28 family amino/carboxypeptidase